MVLAGSLCCIAWGCRTDRRSDTGSSASTSGDGKIPITSSSDSARALAVRGRVLNESLRPHEAYLVFQQAVALDPSFAYGEYSLAATAPTAKDAALHLREALDLSDSVSVGERLLILAQQSRKAGDPARTRRLTDSLVALYPTDERAHWQLANACSAQLDHACAIRELRTAITINPAYSLAYNQLGYAYRSAGRMAAAESAFTRYIALVPNDPNPYDSYAELLMKLGRFDESITQYRKALAIDVHFTGAFTGIAANELYAGRPESSIAESERYLRVARDDRERRSALTNLTMTHVARGATASALQSMQRAFALAEATGDTVNMSADDVMMADMLLAAGRVAEAQQHYRRAHERLARSSAPSSLKNDDALAAHYDDSRVALARHDRATARREAALYGSGAAARGNTARVQQSHELHGLIALESGEFAEALREFALADTLNPAVMVATARAHDALGDMGRAKALRDAAMQLNVLPTLPYMFTRASLGGAIASVSSRSAAGTPR